MAISDLFPTKSSFVIFVAYMALFINQGLLVTASKKEDGKYAYNATTVVLLTEMLKLIIAVALHVKDAGCQDMMMTVRENVHVFGLYFVPAFLYCLYNNLAFVNLLHYDPTSYFLLLQLRVVVTGVIFQVLFSKQLSRIQWASLLLLTAGCIIKQFHLPTKSASTTNSPTAGALPSVHFAINLHFFLILLQVFCSCFAGVYNEYLLKGRSSAAVPLMLQNVFMYFDSIVANVLVLGFGGNLNTALSSSNVSAIFNWKVLGIIVNNAMVGIVTSLFLKSLNSILKTFASALELMFTAVLAWMIFGIAIDLFTVIAIGVVTVAIYLYSQNPVHNPPKDASTKSET